jgi:hypothetical protein
MATSEEALERELEPVEAQKPVWREATISITRNLWSMHAMSHRVLEVLGLVSGKVLSMAEGPLRDPESEYERDSGPKAGPWIRRRRQSMKRPTNWLAMGLAVMSILTTLGAWIWWGGRLSQRMETVEVTQKTQGESIRDISNNNARQDIALGVTGQQYADIIRRLDAIDGKLDRR